MIAAHYVRTGLAPGEVASRTRSRVGALVVLVVLVVQCRLQESRRWCWRGIGQSRKRVGVDEE